MKVFFSETHRLHHPRFEVFDGGVRVPNLETPYRMDTILSALRNTDWVEIGGPEDFGLDPILAVHDSDYIRFLETSWQEWLDIVPGVETQSDRTVLLPATFALRRARHKPAAVLGRAGYYMTDLSAGIMEGTYKAALASANCALSGAQWISHGERAVFALCRPPGHHAGKDYCGGYCYINNAAVSAHWLSSLGKVAILDIDYHAGNGAQDIFYTRSDVLTISLHGDPNFEYPYYAGYVHETGAGKGRGFHRNFVLPAGADNTFYLHVLENALEIIWAFDPLFLVVSVGMDIYEHDPLGHFKITREGIGEIGNRIAQMDLPTLAVMEGGYNTNALGENVVAFASSLK